MVNFKSTTHYLNLLNDVAERGDLQSLSTLDVEAVVAYGYMNVIYGELKIKKEEFIEKNTGKIKNVRRKWDTSEDGKKMIQLKYNIKAMESILKAIKNKIIVTSIEKKETLNN